MLKDLLIGDNAFIGVSHLSNTLARQRFQELRAETIIEAISEALSCGATGFTFSVHPRNLGILEGLAESGTLNAPLAVWPVLPYAAGYVRAVNERGMRGLVSDVLSRLRSSDKAKALLRGGISALTLDPIRMLNAYLDVELCSIQSLDSVRLAVALLHEVVTDLGVSFQARDLFDSYMQKVREENKATPGFVTRNLSRFVAFFQESGLPLKDVVIMTPFNSSGFQMNPSRNSCEATLSSLTNTPVIAMSIMAGGYLGLDQALDYIRNLPRLSGVAVGASTKEHARETFTKLRTLN